MNRRIPVIVAGSLLAAALLGSASGVEAQRQFGTQPPKTWAGVYGLMYTSVSGMRDPGSQSRWLFDDAAFGGGAFVQRQVGQSLRLGVDGSVARPKFERRNLTTDLIEASGTASIATAMATGRYGYSGGSDIGFYLAGGIGAVAYQLGELDWNADFALQAGTGLEYRFGGNKALALEWGRTWGYHEKEDLGGGNQTHSALRLGLGFGF
ncbi:MAG: outer membrane beta-barrel protein [Gemmatimonadetes bacterium]|nr:outer membrane beta-barrel protein [Gemmatimonadota bacterium]